MQSNNTSPTILQLEVQFLEQLDPFFKDITLQTVVIDNPDNPHDLSWIGETLWIDEECFSGGFPICDFARKCIMIRDGSVDSLSLKIQACKQCLAFH